MFDRCVVEAGFAQHVAAVLADHRGAALDARWGFGKPEFEEYELEENEKAVKFLKWELPVSYVNKTFREREQVTRIYSNKEAFEAAKDLARKKIKSSLDENAKVKGEKVLHQSIDNGKVTIAIHFQIIENIAEGQPIIQGDSE